MSLLGLPVELQREIYGYLLSPGRITVRGRSEFHYIDIYPFNHQRSGRQPRWHFTPIISTPADLLQAGLCDRLHRNITTFLTFTKAHTSSRYVDYQIRQLMQHHQHDHKMTIIDCSPGGFSASAGTRSKSQVQWCACQSWPITVPTITTSPTAQCWLRNMPWLPSQYDDDRDANTPRSHAISQRRDVLNLGILLVCKETYMIARDMVWEENVLHFECQEDLQRFLSVLTERQRSKLRKVQIVTDMVVLLG